MRKSLKHGAIFLLVLALVCVGCLGCAETAATPTAAPDAPTAAPAAPEATAAPAATTAPSGASEDPITLTFQGKWFGLETQKWASSQKGLADKVKEASNGRLLIENVDEVVADDAVLDGVRTGVVDIAVQGLHSRGELRTHNFISLPFVTFDKLRDALDQTQDITLPLWDSLGVKGLGHFVFLPQFLYSSEPLTTFDALTSAKLRVTGNIVSDMLTKAGGHPLNMENAEVYQALQRGTTDGAQTALGGYIGNGWYEVAKYISAWPLGCNALGIIINQDSWDKLGPELQGILVECIEETEKEQYEAAVADIEGLEKVAFDKGAERLDPEKAEVDKFLEFAAPAVDDWKAKSPEPEAAAEILTILNDLMGTDY